MPHQTIGCHISPLCWHRAGNTRNTNALVRHVHQGWNLHWQYRHLTASCPQGVDSLAHVDTAPPVLRTNRSTSPAVQLRKAQYLVVHWIWEHTAHKCFALIYLPGNLKCWQCKNSLCRRPRLPSKKLCYSKYPERRGTSWSQKQVSRRITVEAHRSLEQGHDSR